MEQLSTVVLAAQRGDKEAFAMLVQRFESMAYTFAYRTLRNVQLAEDVMQEAFVEAYVNLPNLRNSNAFPGWFRRILSGQVERLIRGKQLGMVSLHAESDIDVAVEEVDPAQIVEEYELQKTVRQAIGTLPEHEQVVIHLFYGTGYALKEIAEFLELPLGTVKKRLFDARKHLRYKLTYTMDAVRGTIRTQRSPTERAFATQLRLLIAARTGDIDDAVQLLKGNPMLVNARATISRASSNGTSFVRPHGHTALHEAAKYGQFAFASLLLHYGANPNACTRFGFTPLHEATASQQKDMVELLLVHRASPNAASSRGLTPLHWATMNGNSAIVSCLLQYGATPDVYGQSGRTPLHWAAIKGHAEIVQLLLSKGADATRCDEFGRTPLTWARRRGHQAIETLLTNFSLHERIEV